MLFVTLTTPLFPLGRTVITSGALAAFEEAFGIQARLKVADLLHRHECGDDGDMDADDKRANVRALRDGERIFSGYDIADFRVWIITEWDRSYTTVLLPEEY